MQPKHGRGKLKESEGATGNDGDASSKIHITQTKPLLEGLFGVTMQPSSPLGEESLQPYSLESAEAAAMDLHIDRSLLTEAPRSRPNYPMKRGNGALLPLGHPSLGRDVRPLLSRWTRRCWSATVRPGPPHRLKWLLGWGAQRKVRWPQGSQGETSLGCWRAPLSPMLQGPHLHY